MREPLEPMKERHRDRRTFAVFETAGQDVRYALRILRKNPGFTTTAIATLALAIGANTAIFSVLNAVLLRPLPYRSPDQLAMLWTEIPGQSVREGRSAYLNVDEWRQRNRSFTDIAVFDPGSVILTSGGDTDRISVARVSPNFFSVLGVAPRQGRTFTDQEADERQRVALISYRFWQTRFGSRDPLGESIELDGLPSRIIGVLPEGFQFASPDVWQPHTLFPDWETSRRAVGAGPWFVIGRLRPGVTVDQAQTDMNAVARRLGEALPAADRNRGVSVVPLSLHVVGSSSRLALWMLTGACLCVLLIAAANVASLSLTRNVGRSLEISIRAALGASAPRIVRQLLAESMTLVVLSGALGLLLAHAGTRIIKATAPGDLARLDEASLDLRVLGWTLAVSLLTGVLVGLASAIPMWRRNLRPSGDEGGRSISDGASIRRIRRGLVIGEFALAIVLLIGAGLLLRSWWSVANVDPGFRPGRVLSIQLSTAAFSANAPRVSFYADLLEQIQSLPGVERAGIIGDLFVSSSSEQAITVEGDVRAVPERLRFRRDEVSGGFFKTVGAPLLKGRVFSAEDGRGSERVAIVNAAMATRLWPDRDPVGRRFALGGGDPNLRWFTVIGVVGDMRRQGLENEPIAQMFEPLEQNPSRLATLLVRTSADDPLKMVGILRATARQVDKRVPLYGVTTLDNRLGAFLSQRRFQTSLLIGLAGVALLMAAIGIYGLNQYSVVARTREIGIRIAVGAQAGEIFRMIIREGLTLSLTGLLLGLVAAWWIGRAGSSLLFGVTATDPLTFLSVSLLLVAVGAAASFLPARRAARIDPVRALRGD